MAAITHVSPLAPAQPPDVGPVAGVRWAAVEAGIRYRDRLDLMLLEVHDGTTVAGALTRSTAAGHPVHWCREVLGRGRARAVIVNAGNANVLRGVEGDAAVRAEAEAVAARLGCSPDEVLVASTGVIGERLPVERIIGKVDDLVAALRPDGIAAAARAIMTTDTFPKLATVDVDIGGSRVRIAGIAKGSGMIAPDMATMLAFVVTDARLEPVAAQAILAGLVDRTFNCTTVDSDTSTSDTLLLLATGRAEHPPDADLGDFREGLEQVLRDLALQVVKDGEGAQKLVTITVTGAQTDPAARRIALAVANSPLVKTAIAGSDANWGRVVMAVGKSGEVVDLARLRIAFGETAVARDGAAVVDLDEGPVTRHLAGREVEIAITVGTGPGVATVWTCDLTHGYIDINADYRS